jgi:Protein of unknown function (DUF3313)
MMNQKLLVSLLASLALLSGCVSNQAKPGAAVSSVPQSGFLGDYSVLKPVDGEPGSYRFIDARTNFRPYTKVMIEPVQVFVTPQADYKGMQPDVLKRMTDAFRMEFVGAMLSGYQVVDQPGPDVLRFRLAITGVHPVRPDLGVTDFIPVKAVFNVAREAAGEAPRVAEISAELEVVDPSGKVVASAVSTRKGDKSVAKAEKITWAELQAIAATWAKNLRSQLDLLRGR